MTHIHYRLKREQFKETWGFYPNRICSSCDRVWYASSLISEKDMMMKRIQFNCPNCRDEK